MTVRLGEGAGGPRLGGRNLGEKGAARVLPSRHARHGGAAQGHARLPARAEPPCPQT